MSRAKIIGLGLSGVLAATCVAACGQDPQERYCEAVEENQSRLGEIVAEGEQDAMIRALPIFEELAAEAPSDIRDEWRTVIDAVRDFDEAVTAAGVDAGDYDPKDPPEGLSQEQRQEIRRSAQELVSEDTVEALSGLEQQARDVCQTPLEI